MSASGGKQTKKRGVRFFTRLLLHGFALIVLMGVGVAAGGKLFILPAMTPAAKELTGWILEQAVRSYGDPEALARDLEKARTGVRASISVYDPTGALVASSVTPPLAPPAPELMRRLDERGGVESSPGLVFAPVRQGGRVVAYAVLSQTPPSPPASRLLLVFALCLGLVTLASIPLTRHVVRPLEELRRAASRVGAGDLTTRVAFDRGDELGDVARSFDDMAMQLAIRLRAEKDLLANVSHELRTPLARIRVVLELASENDPREVPRYLAEIASDLGELERLLEDVFTTARLGTTEGKVPLRADITPIADLVDRCRARFLGLYPDRTLEVDVTLPPDREDLLCDPVLLRRALDNLLDNAAKYTPRGAEVRLSGGIEGGSLVLEVSDDGPGMPAEAAARVFEPFFRGDAGRDRRTGGVGLGLSLVRRIAEAHGGDVKLQSAPGEGVRVTLRIPAAEG